VHRIAGTDAFARDGHGRDAGGQGRQLNDGEIAYVRKDSDDRGLFYNSSGKKGPRGLVRSPSWSPDGKLVVYHRFLSLKSASWQEAWSRNSRYGLVNTESLPAFDPSGQRLIATVGFDAAALVATSAFVVLATANLAAVLAILSGIGKESGLDAAQPGDVAD
jgi:hypothetical protein